MIDTINSSMNQDTDFNPIIEYIPFMSTIHAIKALFDKATHLPSMSPQSIAKSRYYSHVSSTSYTRQLTLMIPILGNLIIYLYDQSRKNLIERTSPEPIGCKKVNISSHSKTSTPALNEAFIEAIKRDDVKKVEELIESGADLNTPVSYPWTFYDMDAYINTSALTYCIRHKRQKMVKILLKNSSLEELNEALILDLEEKNRGMFVEDLIIAGADVNYMCKSSKKIPLQLATTNCDVKTVSCLIKAGANINRLDAYGKTALIEAALHSSPAMVSVLLKAGSNVNHTDRYGKTALMAAVERGNLEIVQILLKTSQIHQGAFLGLGTKPINYANEDGDTALMLAIRNVRYSYFDQRGYNVCMNTQKIVQTLLSTPGIDIDHANKKGETAKLLLEKLDKEMKKSSIYIR